MKAITTDQLYNIIERHAALHGDDKIMIYDDYAGVYKTFTMNNLSVMPDGRLVIECKREKEL